jgi:hypothetical protein
MRLLFCALAAGAVVAMADPRMLLGQQPQVVRHRIMNGPGLAGRPYSSWELSAYGKVSEEIKVTPEQRGRIQQFWREATAKIGVPLYPSTAIDAERQRLLQEIDQKFETQVLSPEQGKRLHQIMLQVNGPQSFLTPEVITRLRLTGEQVAAIRAVVERGNDLVKQAETLTFEWVPGTPRPTFEEIERANPEQVKAEVRRGRLAALEARALTLRTIADLLQPEQRAAYRKMIGEPIDVARVLALDLGPAPPTGAKKKRSRR